MPAHRQHGRPRTPDPRRNLGGNVAACLDERICCRCREVQHSKQSRISRRQGGHARRRRATCPGERDKAAVTAARRSGGGELWRRGQPQLARRVASARCSACAARCGARPPTPLRLLAHRAALPAFCGSAWLRGCGEPSGARRGSPRVHWAGCSYGRRSRRPRKSRHIFPSRRHLPRVDPRLRPTLACARLDLDG